MAVGRIQVAIVGDASGLSRSLKQAQVSIGGLGGAFKTLAKVSAGAFAVKGVTSALGAYADFEQQLNTFQAVSHATGDQMRNVSDLAKALGKDITLPATSAKDAADAMTELAKGGLSVSQSMDAAKGVLQLSAAAQISNADAATITARALNSFNLEGSQATHVADILANAANVSTGEVTDMALALQQSSAVAHQAGLSIEDTAAAISLMANKGVVGSDAGTSLKQMLLSLTPTSVKAKDAMNELGVSAYTSTGQHKKLEAVIQQYHDALSKLTPVQRDQALKTIFGSDATRAANIIFGESAKTFDRMKESVSRSGGASELAAAKMKGLKGAVEALHSNFETLLIDLGQRMAPAAETAVRALSGIVSAIDDIFSGGPDKTTGLIQVLRLEPGQLDQATQGITGRIRDSMQAAMAAVDWSAVGDQMLSGLEEALKKGSQVAQTVAGVVRDAVREIDWTFVGRQVGPGLATAVAVAISTALDPAFWVKNWDVALAVGLTIFGGTLGRLALRLVGPVVARVFESAVLSTAEVIERLSPRLATAFLSGMLKVPQLLAKALSSLTGLVSSAFKRLGAISSFVVKVLGIDAAINGIAAFVRTAAGWFAEFAGAVQTAVKAAIAWIKSLPGQVKGAFAGAGTWLVAAGEAVIGGFISGIRSKIGELTGLLKHITDLVPLKKGPPAKDAVMLYPAGQLVMQGFIRGIESKQSALRTALAAQTREVNKIQAALDAINARREKEDLASAVRDTYNALLEARKKGEGVVAAERAYDRAREDVRVAALQRELTARQNELTASQAHYDKVQTAFQKAQDKLKDTQQKAADAMQRIMDKARDRAAASMSKLTDLIQRGFDAANDAWVSPAQQAINAIQDRRAQEDLKEAVSDARARLDEAMQSGDPEAITDAQRTLNRAIEDIQLASLQKQAEQQNTAHQQAMQALQDQLSQRIAEAGGSMEKILAVIKTYVGGFKAAGKNLGDAFADELRAAMSKAIEDAAAVKAVSSTAAAVRANLIGNLPSFDTGGYVASTGLAMVHRGETVVPAGKGGGGMQVNVTVHGFVGNDQDIAARVRNALLAYKRSNGELGLA